MSAIFPLVIGLVGSLTICAQENSRISANGAVPAQSNAPIRMVAPGEFEIGKVTLDQVHRSVTFPAMLNRIDVPMEYFLVTAYGKTHESILKTAVSPYDIHLAMVLLGAVGAGDTNFPGVPANGIPGPIVHPSSATIPGDKIAISVRWKTADGEVRRPAEDLVFKNDTRTVMQHGAWVYNGSLLVQGKFLSQVDGSIISLVTDPVALINNTGPGHDNDEIWLANTNNLPPPNIPVEITVSLTETKAK